MIGYERPELAGLVSEYASAKQARKAIEAAYREAIAAERAAANALHTSETALLAAIGMPENAHEQ